MKLELEVNGNFYRAEKLKLYSDGINLELGEGKILGSMRVTAEMDTEVPAEAGRTDAQGTLQSHVRLPAYAADLAADDCHVYCNA